jgi:hypothetical protein
MISPLLFNDFHCHHRTSVRRLTYTRTRVGYVSRDHVEDPETSTITTPAIIPTSDKT